MPNTPGDKELLIRLEALEREGAVRACMNRYMQLCDVLGVGFELETLTSLFTEDAVWEGKGTRYAATFGRYEGRSSIASMFAKYTLEPAHFALNIHLLGNEMIVVDGESAKGSWVLMQPSEFSSGKSQLSCARISAEFVFTKGECLIRHFQTENIFSRPMNVAWNQSAELPVPK